MRHVAGEYRVAESLCLGKLDQRDLCEDVIGEGADFAVICDGATDKTGLRFDGVTGGRVVARLVADVVTRARRGCTAADLIGEINDEYARVFATWGVEDGARPAASFCAIEKATGRLIRVGDISWRTARQVNQPRSVPETRLALARSTYLRCLQLGGASASELAADDPGRRMILPALIAQSAAVNNLAAGDLAIGVINGTPVPECLIEEWTVDDDAVVIASDGYPVVEMTLADTEAYLARDLHADPLRIGRHPATKCAGVGMTSFDDRAYLRLEKVHSLGADGGGDAG